MLNLVKYRVVADTIHMGKFYARDSVVELAEDKVDNNNFVKCSEFDRTEAVHSATVKTTVKK